MAIQVKRDKVEVEYLGRRYEFWVRQLTVREYLEVLRSAVGNQGKIRSVAGEPAVLDLDLISYSYELVRRCVEDFGEFGSVDNLPQEVFGRLLEKANELNPFLGFFAG
ncbi:MAG: hypothetical protein QXI60_08490 [Thermofilaceae archaeon]